MFDFTDKTYFMIFLSLQNLFPLISAKRLCNLSDPLAKDLQGACGRIRANSVRKSTLSKFNKSNGGNRKIWFWPVGAVISFVLESAFLKVATNANLQVNQMFPGNICARETKGRKVQCCGLRY